MTAQNDQQTETRDEAVRRARMHLLTCLTRGFSHDFNNALTPILGASDFLLTHQQVLDNREDLLQLLSTVRDSAGAARDLVERLRAMYRVDHTRDVLEVSINQLLELVVATTKDEWREFKPERMDVIHLDLQLNDVPVFPLGESRIRTALHNLISNAADAMDEAGGTLTVMTGADDDRIVIDIHDTGKGMTEEEIQKCMDPFYTTKNTAGAGLGLPIADYILFSNGGSLTIASTPGEGTQVRVVLTEIPKAPPPEPCAEPVIEVPVMRILLLDADERVRDIATRFLIADGHSITMAENLVDLQAAAAAADVVMIDYGAHGQDRDAIHDMVAPHGGHLVWMSRHAEDIPAPVLASLDTVLRKPFVYPELQAALIAGLKPPA